MEAKVHEATNNEAWGASSTLMQEISQGTHNHQYFMEIMPTLYKRFTEKEAKQWRQIYKALVLLEYLVKNGSERVVPDARSHVYMIKMLRSFHYVDEKGKDQGLNVRNRAKELEELLNNTEMIKEERKKAIKNKNKYTGVGSDGGGSYSSGALYGNGGGFSNRGYGNSSGYNGSGSYGEGYGNSGFEGFGSDGMNNDFHDDKYSDGDLPPAKNKSQSESTSKSEPKSKPATAKDLFDFDEPAPKKDSNRDDEWGDFTVGNDDDGFDDFQSAPAGNSSSFTATAPAKKSNDIFDLLGDDVINTSSAISPAPKMYTSSQLTPNNATAVPVSNNLLGNHSNQTVKQDTISQPSTNNTPIGGMWSQASSFVSLDSLGKKAEPVKNNTTGLSMNAMKSSNTNANWNNWAAPATNNVQQPKKSTSAFDDLLL
ncbi:hypothetical protein BY458DRAFT_495726 [Sporodiniella umbellata]|nr:hypothetical protein BY458DRAFT_495726 [Sporodiniella umbellata]